MDPVLSYLTGLWLQTRYFVSDSPSSTLLLWAPNNDLKNFKCVMTRQDDFKPHPLEGFVIDALRRAGIDVFQVTYTFKKNVELCVLCYSEDLHKNELISKDERMIAEDFAEIIGLPFSENPAAKSPNKEERVNDPFHRWSRKYFGNTTKTDVDAIAISNSQISRILEIKRSSQIEVGKWQPFPADKAGITLLAHLAHRLQVSLRVIHYNPQNCNLSNCQVDLFQYIPDPDNFDFDFNNFKRNGRKVDLGQAI